MPEGQAVIQNRSGAGFSSVHVDSDRTPLFTGDDLLRLIHLYPMRYLSAFAPPGVLRGVGKLAAPCLQFRAREARQRATRRIRAMLPDLTPTQAARIAWQTVANDIHRELDDLRLLQPSSRQRLHCTGIEGIEYLDEAVAAGKGVILATAHFCATRIAVRHLDTLGYTATVVQNRIARNRREGHLGRRLRQRHVDLRSLGNTDVIYLQDAECSLKILQRLRAAGLVHMHFLDALSVKTFVEGSLLGVPWRFPAGVFDFARLTGCAVVPMLCLGSSAGFRVRFSPIHAFMKAGSREEFIRSNLPALAEIFERQIAGHPEEWRLWTWQ